MNRAAEINETPRLPPNWSMPRPSRQIDVCCAGDAHRKGSADINGHKVPGVTRLGALFKYDTEASWAPEGWVAVSIRRMKVAFDGAPLPPRRFQKVTAETRVMRDDGELLGWVGERKLTNRDAVASGEASPVRWWVTNRGQSAYLALRFSCFSCGLDWQRRETAVAAKLDREWQTGPRILRLAGLIAHY